MTDRELLELAAKAMNLEIFWADGVKHSPVLNSGETWNPIINDGDALRLAVKLNCMPEIDYEMGYVTIVLALDKGIQEIIRDDPYATTRRAIVRAAAEIGKEKK